LLKQCVPGVLLFVVATVGAATIRAMVVAMQTDAPV
jgi:hypothetical protein